MTEIPGEPREARRQLLQQPLADSVRWHLTQQRLRQTVVAHASGINRSFLRYILRTEKGCSLFVFLELSHALAADPSELLKDVLNRLDALHKR